MIPFDDDGCIIWPGTKTRGGYGQVCIDYKMRPAHRVAYETHVGPVPDGLQLDHLCRNPACVNPEHLEPVTAAENSRRRSAIKTHCPQGHIYDEANTYVVTGKGWRRCRTCNRTAALARYHAKRSRDAAP